MPIIDLKTHQKRGTHRRTKDVERAAAKARAEASEAPKASPAPVAVAAAPAEPSSGSSLASRDPEWSMTNTKAELTAAAEAAGVEVEGSWTKAQILGALQPEG